VGFSEFFPEKAAVAERYRWFVSWEKEPHLLCGESAAILPPFKRGRHLSQDDLLEADLASPQFAALPKACDEGRLPSGV
jgi:hypothetical protein